MITVGKLFKKKDSKDEMSAELKNLQKMEKEGEVIQRSVNHKAKLERMNSVEHTGKAICYLITVTIFQNLTSYKMYSIRCCNKVLV